MSAEGIQGAQSAPDPETPHCMNRWKTQSQCFACDVLDAQKHNTCWAAGLRHLCGKIIGWVLCCLVYLCGSIHIPSLQLRQCPQSLQDAVHIAAVAQVFQSNVPERDPSLQMHMQGSRPQHVKLLCIRCWRLMKAAEKMCMCRRVGAS